MRLMKKKKKKRAQSTQSKEDWQRFRLLKKTKTSKAYRQAYFRCVADLVEKHSNTKNLWHLIKNKKSDYTGTAPPKSNGLTDRNPKDKANTLNEQLIIILTII